MKIIDPRDAKNVVSSFPDVGENLTRGMSAKELCTAAACSLELHMAVYCKDVVLCGECRFYKPLNSPGEKEWGICNKINIPATYPGEFCSRGERRSNE